MDDSGDPGFKFDRGSTTHVVMAACVFEQRADLADAMALIENGRTKVGPDGQRYRSCREFKYSSTKQSHKADFFAAIRPARFHVRTIICDKRVIRSDHLRSNPNDLKSYLIRQLLTHTRDRVRNAKLIIDGQDTRSFGASDREYFMRMVNAASPGTLREIEWTDSKRSTPIQLADMIAGSIRRRAEGCTKAEEYYQTYRSRLRPPDGNYWAFK